MLKTLVTALFIAAAVAAAPASAQSASPTLARIKAAKAINVAYSADSPPFSMTGPMASLTCWGWKPRSV